MSTDRIPDETPIPPPWMEESDIEPLVFFALSLDDVIDAAYSALRDYGDACVQGNAEAESGVSLSLLAKVAHAKKRVEYFANFLSTSVQALSHVAVDLLPDLPEIVVADEYEELKERRGQEVRFFVNTNRTSNPDPES